MFYVYHICSVTYNGLFLRNTFGNVTIKLESHPFLEMRVVPAAGGARGPAGLLRRAPLARPAAVLQVCRLRQVPGGPALHGAPERPLLFSGVQEEGRGLRVGAT